MVTTMRDKEVFLLAPENDSTTPVGAQPTIRGAILVVEDDTPTLRLERVLLEEEGYTVEVVASGEEAIEAIAAKEPALVLLDIGLPGMDGFMACQRIREFSHVPIIMVTGRDCLDDKVAGMNVGADDYVTKPFLTHELATRVKVLLRRSSSENEASQGSNGTGHSQHQPFGGVPEHHTNGVTPSPKSEVQAEPVLAQQPAAALEAGQSAATDISPAAAPEPVTAVPEASNDDLYEGTVRLTITTSGPVSHLINFVSELRQNARFRLLRLVANQHKEGMDIWLGLREPLPLISSLKEISGVSAVATSPAKSPNGDEPVFKVLLN